MVLVIDSRFTRCVVRVITHMVARQEDADAVMDEAMVCMEKGAMAALAHLSRRAARRGGVVGVRTGAADPSSYRENGIPRMVVGGPPDWQTVEAAPGGERATLRVPP